MYSTNACKYIIHHFQMAYMYSLLVSIYVSCTILMNGFSPCWWKYGPSYLFRKLTWISFFSRSLKVKNTKTMHRWNKHIFFKKCQYSLYLINPNKTDFSERQHTCTCSMLYTTDRYRFFQEKHPKFIMKGRNIK